MESIDLILIFILFILALSSFIINEAHAEPSQQSYFWSGFEFWYDKIGISGIILTLVLYLHRQRSDRIKDHQVNEKRLRRSKVTLLQEVKENKEGLDRFDRMYFSYVKSRQTIEYTNVHLDSYAYQSIIHSGLLTYLEDETQTRLAQLYSRIDGYNESTTYRSHLDSEYYLYEKRKVMTSSSRTLKEKLEFYYQR